MFEAWNPEKHAIGLKVIDAQHERLHEIVGELYESIVSGNYRHTLGNTLQKLIDYTDDHFKYEEALFVRWNYEYGAVHKAQHNDFLNKMKDWKKQFDNGHLHNTFNLVNFLRNWIKVHTFSSDVAYVDFMRAHGLE